MLEYVEWNFVCTRGQYNMPHYRAYLLNKEGHISNAIDMECADDEQAKECAKKFISGENAELWHEDRLIATYTGTGGARNQFDQPG